MTVVLDGMDVARMKPNQTKLTNDPQCAMLLVRTPAASGGHQFRGRLEVRLLPGERRPQARITNGVGGWGMNLGGDKKRDWLSVAVSASVSAISCGQRGSQHH